MKKQLYLTPRKYIIIKDAADDLVLAIATSTRDKLGNEKVINLKENTLFGILGFERMENGVALSEDRVVANNGFVGKNLFKLEY